MYVSFIAQLSYDMIISAQKGIYVYEQFPKM